MREYMKDKEGLVNAAQIILDTYREGSIESAQMKFDEFYIQAEIAAPDREGALLDLVLDLEFLVYEHGSTTDSEVAKHIARVRNELATN